MPFNALLLPLLGGYIFVQRWNRTRFSNTRHSGQRLLFHAAVGGSVFLALSHALALATERMFPGWVAAWQGLVPFDYAGTSATAFVLGATAWAPLNRWVNKRDEEAQRAIDNWNDYLEILLQRALRNTQQVSLTTRSRKFYVGFVTSNFDPAYERKYIKVLPTLSGYRHPEELTFRITTDYAAVYDQLLDRRPEFLEEHADNFEIIIPVEEIASANIFDPDAFDLFRETVDG